MRHLLLITLAVAVAACSGDSSPPPSGGAAGASAGTSGGVSGGASVSGGAAVAGPGAWVDPEPAGAQALAEEAVKAAWNADKTTRLQMSITTLVNTTTGIVGFKSQVAGGSVPLEDRLSRLGAKVTDTEVTISLPGSVLFDFDSAEVRPDAERTLSDVAEVLKAYAQRPVRIEGHTDSIASDEYNQALSERRARSVGAWLAAHGVKARATTRGFGETKPVAGNETPDGRQRNRRVEIIVEKAG